MKSATFPKLPPSSQQGTPRGIDPARAAIVRAWRRLGLIASGAVTSAQISRMAATLDGFTDSQLAAIGIQRHEIYSHAEKLVLTRGDDGPDEPRA